MRNDARILDLHGQRMCLTDVGTGPPILFVHGLMSSRRTWADQMVRLAADHRVLAPDLFGHGESVKPLGDYSLGAHAASLRDLLDSLEVESVCVVGHSLGGGIAMQFAYLFPERVERLVLVSSGGLGRELNPVLRAATLPGSEFILPVLASGWVHDIGDSAMRLWSRVGLPAVSPSTTEAWRSLTTLADVETRRAFLATSRSVIDAGGQTVSARNRLSGLLSRDVLLIWGEGDRMIPPAHVEAARAELPHSQVAILPRSGHFPHLDEPDAFAAVLAAFVHSPGRAAGDPAPSARPA